jgi:hypothetical protein
MLHKFLCVFLGIALTGSVTTVMAQESPEPAVKTTVPRLITFNGVVQDRNARERGVVGITFALYRDQRGGAPLWIENQNLQVNAEGRYTVLLGATQGDGLPIDLFASGEPRWLGIQSPGEEEQPRVLLVSVPYALKAADADTIGGRPASSFVLADKSADPKETAMTRADAAAPPTFAVSGTGTTNRLTKWLDPFGTLGDSAVFESGGKVGIGTTAPISSLNVVTNSSDYITLSAYRADVVDKGFLVRSARGVQGAPLAVQNGNTLFNLYAQGFDGVDYSISGGVTMAVDGAVSAGKVPGLILFKTADANGTYAERMRVNAAGDVGIGTSSPSAKLEVNGSAKVNGQMQATYFVGDGSQLTNVPGSGSGTAVNLTCSQPCVSSPEIEDGTIVDADVSSSAAIAPAKIAGTAAIVGANTFTATQTISLGNLAISTGNLALPATISPGSGVVTVAGNRFLHGLGTNNTFLGTNAGTFGNNGIGVNNTGSGAYSLSNIWTGSQNTANGAYSLLSNTTGQQNTAVGSQALQSNTTANFNTAVGFSALQNNTVGANNTATGVNALQFNTGGGGNTASGAEALLQNTTGSENTANGRSALGSNRTGTENTAIGSIALVSNSGNQNTASGAGALQSNTTGSNNTAIGYDAGFTNNFQNANTTGSNNTFIGYKAGPGTNTQLNNASAIGANALVSASNALVLGDSAVSVGIGTSAPTAKLDVNGGIRLNTSTSKPACNASSRGTFWFTQGGTGVKDTAEVCAKDAGDAYAWRTLY